MIAEALRIVSAALIGACLGSFIATAVVRRLRGEQVLTGRSHCDGCARPLAAWATVPVLSYAISAGGCRRCGARIDPLHPAGELLGAVIVGLAWSTPAATPTALLTDSLVTGLVLCLLALALYDARTFRIPDLLTLGVLASGLGLVVLENPSGVPMALSWGVLTCAVLEALRRLYRRSRSVEGLGFGDVKLLGALAVWLQAGLPWALLLACASALLWIGFTRYRQRLAFGPFIALSALVIGIGRQRLGLG